MLSAAIKNSHECAKVRSLSIRILEGVPQKCQKAFGMLHAVLQGEEVCQEQVTAEPGSLIRVHWEIEERYAK